MPRPDDGYLADAAYAAIEAAEARRAAEENQQSETCNRVIPLEKLRAIGSVPLLEEIEETTSE